MPPPPPQGPALHAENWSPCWRSWPGRIGEELEAQGFASPSIVVVGEVVAQRVVAQRVEAQRVDAQRVDASAPEPAPAEPLPLWANR